MDFLKRLFSGAGGPKDEPLVERDITSYVLGARRGLRRDIAELIKQLPRGALYAPLNAAIPGAAPDVIQRVETETTLSCQVLFDPKGRRFGVFFTRPEFLGAFGKNAGWKTDGGPLSYIGLGGPAALALHREGLASGRLAGLVINPARPEELTLTAEEAGLIAKGEAIPLERYIVDLPVQPGEKVITGRPAVPPAESLASAIAAFVRAEPRLKGHEILQCFMPERHRRPHLLLSLKPSGPGIDQAAVARDLQLVLKKALPEGEFIDIVFDARG